MEGNNSFDVEEFESDNGILDSTAWSKVKVASRSKETKMYGRSRFRDPSLSYFDSDLRNPLAKDEDEDTDVEDQQSNSMSPVDYSSFGRGYSITTPPTRRTKKFVRAKSTSDASPPISRPRRLTQMIRSQSVSTFNPQRSISAACRSFSMGQTDYENSNPNLSTLPSDDEDYTSPKRLADTDATQKGRKKSKSAKHSFLRNNDFTSLYNDNYETNY